MLDRKKVRIAKRVINEMLQDRGLQVEWLNQEEADESDRAFLDSLEGKAEGFKITWTHVLSADTVKSSVADFGQDLKLRHILMMVGSETSAAKEKVAAYNRVRPDHKIEVWRWDMCQFNVIKHVLVPKHILASQEEFDLICTTHHLKPEEFPALLTTDPVCRWFDFPVDHMVKIIRSDKSISYRVVKRPAV